MLEKKVLIVVIGLVLLIISFSLATAAQQEQTVPTEESVYDLPFIPNNPPVKGSSFDRILNYLIENYLGVQ